MYDKLVKMIQKAPATYYPALLGHLVKAAYEKDVFLKSGASSFITSWEKQNGRSAEGNQHEISGITFPCEHINNCPHILEIRLNK